MTTPTTPHAARLQAAALALGNVTDEASLGRFRRTLDRIMRLPDKEIERILQQAGDADESEETP